MGQSPDWFDYRRRLAWLREMRADGELPMDWRKQCSEALGFKREYITQLVKGGVYTKPAEFDVVYDYIWNKFKSGEWGSKYAQEELPDG